MRANSTSNLRPPLSIDVDQYGCAWDSALQQIYGSLKLPTMVSKASVHRGIPDQPDRTGMRERREQSEMTLGKLQRRLGIESPENPHTEMLEAYGYRQLAKLVMEMPSMGISMLWALANTMKFRIGPPGADAVPIVSHKSSDSAGLSVNEFVKKYSRDFEIWISPSVRNAVNMKGMIIMIGEDHFTESIQKMIREFMLEFSRERGDRVFIEGSFETGCKGRIRMYQMEAEDCQPLENNSSELEPLSKKGEKIRDLFLECVHYLRKNIPATREEKVEDKLASVQDFLSRRAKELPVSVRNGYNALINKINSLKIEMEGSELRIRASREDRMSASIRTSRTRTAWNFAVVGAAHLSGLRDRLQDLPCIFMVPHGIVATVPSLSLKTERKHEL